MTKIPTLSKEEKEQARQWRVKKCGWDSFYSLFELFKIEIEKKDVKRDDRKNMESS